MDALERRLAQLIFRYWQVPEREGRRLLALLATSSASRAVTLRHHLALAETQYLTRQGIQEADLGHTFAQVLTPKFMLQVVEDLQAVGSLSHHHALVIEEAMLQAIDAQGAWKAV